MGSVRMGREGRILEGSMSWVGEGRELREAGGKEDHHGEGYQDLRGSQDVI